MATSLHPSPPAIDWCRVAYLALASRRLDDIEETQLVPEKRVLYQFSARGHDVAQIILGSLLTHPHDAVSAYYRSRPILLTVGLSLEDAFAGPMGKSGGFSDGRDIGVVCNLPSQVGGGATVLPMSGDVGSQYTPAAGWAQAITYHREVLKNAEYAGAIATVLGGDGSVATNGFWSSLTMATTMRLPMLFYIEDNGYGISVPGSAQTPGGNIAENLKGFHSLQILGGDGTDPEATAQIFADAVGRVRSDNGPVLVRLTVPRLSGHSGQDTQAYKPPALLEEEQANDPLPKLQRWLVGSHLTEDEWETLEETATRDVAAALAGALARPEPDSRVVGRHVFLETDADGAPELQMVGGASRAGVTLDQGNPVPSPSGARINMLTAIRRTLEHELECNPNLLLFGEDVGPKGGVHAATMGLQDTFGAARVFDTSLSEEGIVGRSVGMALAGLTPVAEIQFRKYADPATEQLNNCGTIRWRTNNRFAAPVIVRMPGGFGSKCGDPWHSVTGEVLWAHAVGWQVCFPSNAEDAVGLLRAALRSQNPTIFFEHRASLDGVWARRPYPGDDYLLPLGQGRCTREGNQVTIVTWGAMIERCEQAATHAAVDAEIIDLRTIVPWDRELVLTSVQKTRRCLIVHEDTITAGFGAEIAAVVADKSFLHLDAPVTRVAIPDIPTPYNVQLMEATVPNVERIAAALRTLVDF